MNSLFGTSSSLPSQSRIVVARMRILVTVPSLSPIVTMSPTRIGRSNRMMMPLMKLATISCRPNPMPTPRAATSHWSWSQCRPSADNAATMPMPTMM